jgi:WD40 repeat protein
VHGVRTGIGGSGGAVGDGLALEWAESGPGRIDMEMLRRPEPILFYKHLMLYEDFLHDSGIAQLSLKVRVMPSCWFVLLRYWLRLDGVLVRLCDTRCFHAFGTDFIVREYTVKERPLPAMPPLPAPPAGTVDGVTAAAIPAAAFMPMAPVLKTADEAARMLQHQPPKEARYDLLTLPAAAEAEAEAEATLGGTVGGEVADDGVAGDGGDGGGGGGGPAPVLCAESGLEECTSESVECVAVCAPLGVLAVGTFDGEVLVVAHQHRRPPLGAAAAEEEGEEAQGGERPLVLRWLGHRPASADGFETAAMSLAFSGVAPGVPGGGGGGGAGGLRLVSSGEDGFLKTWAVGAALDGGSGGAAGSSMAPLCAVALDGEGADYTRSGVGGARTACVQLVACPPGRAGGGAEQQKQQQQQQQQLLGAAVGRSVQLLAMSEGWLSHLGTISLGVLESSVTALEFATLPDGGGASSLSLLAACYGAVTIWDRCGQAGLVPAGDGGGGGGVRGPDAPLASRRLSYRGPLMGLCVAPSGGYVAAGCQDGTMHVWSTAPPPPPPPPAAGRSLVEPADFSCGGYDEKVSCHVWSRCGTFLASAGGSHAIVWEFLGGRAPLGRSREAGAICSGQGSRVTALAFGPSPAPAAPAAPRGGGGGGGGSQALLASAGRNGEVVLYLVGGGGGGGGGQRPHYHAGTPNIYLPYRRCVPGVPGAVSGGGGGGAARWSTVVQMAWVGHRLHVASEDGVLRQWQV